MRIVLALLYFVMYLICQLLDSIVVIVLSHFTVDCNVDMTKGSKHT